MCKVNCTRHFYPFSVPLNFFRSHHGSDDNLRINLSPPKAIALQASTFTPSIVHQDP